MILIVLGAAYVLNSVVLKKVYPLVSDSWDQYVSFVATRNIVYEWMFAFFFLLVFLSTHKLVRAVACFFMVLAFGSVVDKTFFGITWYLVSDVLLVVVALLLSIYVYVRENKR